MDSPTCKTCVHWRPVKGSGRLGDAIGTCHGAPPGRDFSFPRTKDCDGCALHKAREVEFATAKPPGPVLDEHATAELFRPERVQAAQTPRRSRQRS